MEIKQLEIYVKVYELKSFSKAAEEIFLSQPSISTNINALEKELQTQLIYRSTKEFVPTKSGKLFYEYAKEILTLRDKSISSLKSLTDGCAGSIDILASSVPAQYILPEILASFHKTHCNILFNVKQADTADVVKGISAHEGEIGFVGAKIENPKCVYEDFILERLVIIAPKEKRFEKVSLSDVKNLLRSECFIIRESGSGTRLEYEKYLENIGINIKELKVCACFDNTQSIINAVANGLGLSVVSELAAKYYIGQKMVTAVSLDSLPQRQFYIVLKKNCVLSPAADAFIKFVRLYGDKYKA